MTMETTEITIIDYLIVLKKHIKMIAAITIGTFLISAFYVMRTPNIYSASTTFYYPLGEKGGSAALGNLAEGALGKEGSNLMSSLLGSPTADLQNYTKGILGSRKIAEMIISNMDLKKRLGIQNEEELIRFVHGSSYIKLSNEGIMEIDVTTTDPKLSADLANAYVEAFREFTLTSMVSVSQKHRQDVETRLAQLSVSLENAENDMVNFQKNYKTVDFNVDARGISQELYQLRAEDVSAEVALSTYRRAAQGERNVSMSQLQSASSDPLISPGFTTPVIDNLRRQLSLAYIEYARTKLTETPQNPELQSYRQQVTNLENSLRNEFRKQMALQSYGTSEIGFEQRIKIAQLESKHQALLQGIHQLEEKFSNYPTVGVDYLRKSRQLKVLESLYTMLSASYEQAKLDEAKEAPNFQVLDRAVVPDQKAGPRRSRNLMLGLLLGALLGISAAFFFETLLPKGKFYRTMSPDGIQKDQPSEKILVGTHSGNDR